MNREDGPDSDRQDMVERVRACIASMNTPSDERSMFGVVTSFVAGHAAVGVRAGGELMIRIDPSRSDELLSRPEAHPLTMGSRTFTGWAGIGFDDLQTDSQLDFWVGQGIAYVHRLPSKATGRRTQRRG
ncbi:TfoX/Sxy family protein [Streptomyces sp. NPDC026672]|uniref:TfoX/Sxy family protein n=1 Tax=unclassified Streptomyces TaxID=2593676 RepID=UPI0033DA2B1C